MKCFIKRVPVQEANLIFLPESIIKEREVIPRRIILQVGKWRYEVKVKIGSVPEKTIGLSTSLKLPFELPEHLPYEMVFKGRYLLLGPIIGLMSFEKEQEITLESLHAYKDHLSRYSDIGGLIYIFAAESFHSTKQAVEGYFYDPEAKDDETRWKYGFFPYPDSIYSRTERQGYNPMISVVGENLFNSYNFDKWEMWDWLSPLPLFSGHLPYTEQLKKVQSVDEMLSKYGSVYIKPIGTGKFFKVDKTGSEYRFIDKSLKEISFNSQEEAGEFLQDFITDHSYLIQETISVKRNEDSCFDFRAILQKNGSKHWNCTGIIARLRDTEIAADFKCTGSSWTGKEALRKFFDLNEREIFIKEQEMINLCIAAGKTLDQCGGNFGDLGIDLVLDQDLKVWIIDINLVYDYSSLYTLKDKQFYFQAVTTPFEYAKSLAEF